MGYTAPRGHPDIIMIPLGRTETNAILPRFLFQRKAQRLLHETPLSSATQYNSDVSSSQRDTSKHGCGSYKPLCAKKASGIYTRLLSAIHHRMDDFDQP